MYLEKPMEQNSKQKFSVDEKKQMTDQILGRSREAGEF